MLRTRTAILAAAADCVARGGVRRTTMSEVSSSGGIAKATLYNHFRTKSDLLEGLLLARIDELGDRAAGARALAGAPRPPRGRPPRRPCRAPSGGPPPSWRGPQHCAGSQPTSPRWWQRS